MGGKWVPPGGPAPGMPEIGGCEMANWLSKNKNDLLIGGIGNGWKLVCGEGGWGPGWALYANGRKHASFFWGADGTIVMVKAGRKTHVIGGV